MALTLWMGLWDRKAERLGYTSSMTDVFWRLMRVLVIIPAYNEEDSILRVANSVADAGYDYLVVIDGASDGTLEVCRENNLNYVNLRINLGIGGAVQTGHKYAIDHGYDVDVQFDGDGQHDVNCIPLLLERIEKGADLVIGSRFISGDSEGFQSTRARRMGIQWLKMCIRVVTGLRITDATSGFRASGRRAMALFANDYPVDYPEPESIVAAYNSGLRVREVPVVMHERQGGTSSINLFKSVYYMIKVTLAIMIEGASSFGRKGA